MLHLSVLLSANMWRSTKEAAEKGKGQNKTDGLTDRCGWDGTSAALRFRSFAPLALYIWSSTCSRLWTTPNCRSAWPLALHHGNIKADCRRIQMSTYSRNLVRTWKWLLLKSLLPPNVYAHLSEWRGKCRKNASTRKTNLAVQRQPRG